MKILIRNCTLVSMSQKRPQIEKNIDILIENDIISKIDKNIIEKNIDKIIDANENVIMPGLINCHCHVAMSIFRETVDGYITQDWLTEKIWPKEAKLTEKDIYEASLLSFKEMIETGTTTVNDMYFFPEETAKAAIESGVRIQLTDTLMDLNGYEAGEKKINSTLNLIKKYKDNPLVSVNFGLHGFYTSSKEYSKRVINLARSNNLNLHVHFCENSQEVSDISSSYHQKPVEVLEELIPESKVILAHSVKLTDEDLDKMKEIKADISIASCPVSNLRLGCGVAPLTKMEEVGLNICLGTDGQGSGSNLDMFEEMKLSALLQKGINENPKLMPAYNILKMATINGAKALGMDKKIGSIEVGKKADLILIDMTSTITTPINNLISELVYNIKGSNVKMTMVDGKILMER